MCVVYLHRGGDQDGNVGQLVFIFPIFMRIKSEFKSRVAFGRLPGADQLGNAAALKGSGLAWVVAERA